MNRELDIVKGIHPGLYLDWKIREKGLKKGKLALLANEYPQTMTAITKGKRDMNTAFALKMESILGLEEGSLMILQVFHDIRKEKKKLEKDKPDLTKFRSVLFWDTDMHKIEWNRQFRSVIRRVFERL